MNVCDTNGRVVGAVVAMWSEHGLLWMAERNQPSGAKTTRTFPSGTEQLLRAMVWVGTGSNEAAPEPEPTATTTAIFGDPAAVALSYTTDYEHRKITFNYSRTGGFDVSFEVLFDIVDTICKEAGVQTKLMQERSRHFYRELSEVRRKVESEAMDTMMDTMVSKLAGQLPVMANYCPQCRSTLVDDESVGYAALICPSCAERGAM